ncbi:spore coat protein [Clostridium botulinum A2B7 92]|uniref:CotS family spore coat protein n=1 Tax=Clostridium botulinum TaxID=1491 RepID=UPI0007E092A9|nr:CotS family spore coat protein [Clostridium botulinum]KEJ01065.1 spore coat protein [Clostridium botulinum A2B7 92]
MGNRRVINYDESEITKKERQMINKILSKYNFNVIDFSKVRSMYKVETTTGNKCLKRTRHGKYKIRNGFIFAEELKNVGFNNIASYYKTKDDRNYIKYKKWAFYATEWIDGDECDLNDIVEAENCAKTLAHFHKATKKIDINRVKVKSHLKKWPKRFNKRISDMDRFKSNIENKKIKNEFDITYKEYIDSFYERAMVALSFLNKSDYYKLSKEAQTNKTLCHHSFYYQNIIKKGREYYIIDLDNIIIDLQVNDLGKYIRRLMTKKSYQWDFEKTKRIIEAYNSENKLTKEDLEVMLSLIIFPHKFWKLGKNRYIKHKHWPETKYMKKLNKIIKYDDMQREFLENYLKYLEQYE